METVVKKRGWVKTAAIVFFAALFLLTFFSNTIMNYSLPQVSGQTMYGGEIMTAVRGSGTVVANEKYKVTLSQTREIRAALVRVGDTVTAGQALFELEDEDSAELQSALKTLHDAEYNYQVKLLRQQLDDDNTNHDYVKLQDNLSKALALREELGPALAVVSAAEAKLESAKSVLNAIEADKELSNEQVSALTEQISDITAQISDIDTEINQQVRDLVDLGLLGGEILELLEAVEKAEQDYQSALDYKTTTAQMVTDAQQAYNEAQSYGSNTQTETEKELSKRETAVTTAQAAVNSALIDGLVAMDKLYKDAYETNAASVPANYVALYAAREEDNKSLMNSFLASLLVEESAKGSTDPAVTAYMTALDALAVAKEALDAYKQLNNSGSGASYADYAQQRLLEAQDRDNKAKTAVDMAKAVVDASQSRYDDGVRDIQISLKRDKLELTNKKKSLEDEQKAVKKTIDEYDSSIQDAQKVIQEAETAVQDAKNAVPKSATSGQALTVESADSDVAAAQRELERATLVNSVNGSLLSMELQRDLDDIAEKRETVERLREEQVGATIVSRYDGVVLTVNAGTGDKPQPNVSLAEIEIAGKGYTLSISVTNAEAERVAPGDTASINMWGMSNINCVLSAIKRDDNDPARRRILEFDISGNVREGQTIELSVGSRAQYYNQIVPNSAIREDSNGKFVLVAVSKKTPLGTRYIAERVDVRVIDSDTTNSAIEGTFEFYPFIITASSKPVTVGSQVRLAS